MLGSPTQACAGSGRQATAVTTQYTSGSYKSDYIHHATLAAPRGAAVAFTLDGEDFASRVPPSAELQPGVRQESDALNICQRQAE